MDSEILPPHTHYALIGLVVALPVVLFVGNAFYNLFLHPLRHVPGPRFNAISRLPYIQKLLQGTTAFYFKELHDKYGPAVRYSPNEITFISQETAWTDIYGFRTGKLKGHANTNKDPMWYAPPANGTPSLLITNDADHSRERRVLSHAFSDKAISAQETLLHQYGNQLVTRLREVIASSSEPVDLVKWYNWTTFDVIADLTFGEPFGCLRDMKTHKYVELLLHTLTTGRFFYIMRYFPWTKFLGSLVIDQKALQSRKEFSAWVTKQAKARIDRDTDRPDFMTHILQHNNTEKGLTEKEIFSNSGLFLVAGTETTATLLSGVTYLLCKNPDVYAKLKNEIRSRWASYDEISIETVNHTPYLLAVLQEALRYYPPVTTGFNRVIPAGGEEVSGIYLQGGTSVCMSQYAAHHSARNFTDPERFAPERWMGDAKYADDKREWMQPFSYGPRNCIGKNLAYAEMRLFMAKMVWSFDFILDERSSDWLANNRIMNLWKKPALLVKVTPVERA